MKKLFLVFLLICSLFSCKDDEPEPKTLTVINGLDQTAIKIPSGTLYYSEFTEIVSIMLYDADKEIIRVETFPVFLYVVHKLKNYHVASMPLEESIKYMVVVIRFYYPDDDAINMKYTSKMITIIDGTNHYTINEDNSERYPPQ